MRKTYLALGLVALSTSAACTREPAIEKSGPRPSAALAHVWSLGDSPGRQVLFNRDGGLLAITDAAGDVVVLSTRDWRPMRRFRIDAGATSVAFGPGATLMVGSYDGSVRSFDLATGVAGPTYSGAKGATWTIDVSPDGERLASGSEDGVIRLWTIASPAAPPRLLRGHERNIWQVRFSPDGRRLASGSFDATLRLWDANLGKPIGKISDHRQAVVGLAFSRDGERLATSGDDSTIRLRRPSDGAAFRTIDAGNHTYTLDFSSDGRWLASGGRARSGLGTFWHGITGLGGTTEPVRLWRVNDGALVLALPSPDDIASVDVSPDGRYLVASSEDHRVRLWRLSLPD